MYNNIGLEYSIFESKNPKFKEKLDNLKKIVQSDNEELTINNQIFESVISQFPNDPYTTQYNNRKNILESLTNIGVSKFIEKVKTTKLYESNFDIQDGVISMEEEIAAGIPEYGVGINYEDFLNSLSWNNKLAADVNNIKNNLVKNEFWILIMNAISSLEMNSMYNQDPIAFLYRSLGLPQTDARHYLLTNCNKFGNCVEIVDLVNKIGKLSSDGLDRISYLTSRFGRTSMAHKITPTIQIAEGFVYAAGKNLIQINESSVKLADPTKILDLDFKKLVDVFENVTDFKDGRFTIRTNAGLVTVTENKQLNLHTSILSENKQIPQGIYAIEESMNGADFKLISEMGDQFNVTKDKFKQTVDMGIANVHDTTVELNGKEIFGDQTDSMEEIMNNGGTSQDIENIQTVQNGIAQICMIKDIMTVTLENGVMIDKIKVPNEIYIVITDLLNNQCTIIPQSNIDLVESASNELGVDLINTEEKTTEDQQNDAKIQAEKEAQEIEAKNNADELGSQLDVVKNSILKLESIPVEERDDEMNSYYSNLKTEAKNLEEQVYQQSVKSEEIELTDDLDHVVDSIYKDLETLRINNQYVAEVLEFKEGSVASSEKYQFSPDKYVGIELHASGDKDNLMLDKANLLVIKDQKAESKPIELNQKYDVAIPEMIKTIIKGILETYIDKTA